MEVDIGFTIEDIHEYFNLRNGKILYSDIVTHFKGPLSNPGTQAEARNKFKDWVNQLAAVTNEDGKKYLVLRAKYMKRLQQQLQLDKENENAKIKAKQNVPNDHKLVPDHNEPSHVVPPTQQITKALPTMPNVVQSKLPPTEVVHHQHHHPPPSQSQHQYHHHQPQQNYVARPPVYDDHHHHPPLQYYPSHDVQVPSSTNMANHPPTIPHHTIDIQQIHDAPNVMSHTDGHYHAHRATECETTDQTSMPVEPTLYHGRGVYADAQENLEPSIHNFETPPPRPPPRKKNSFRGTRMSASSSTPGDNETDNKEINQDVHNQQVQKEIQELAKTPGRVKEHAEIFCKLAQTSVHSPVRANNHGSSSQNASSRIRNNDNDTDSGSVQILDPLRKRWVLAACKCDIDKMKELLYEDGNLAGFKDYLYGNTAVHWACKFNRADVVKLLLGHYKVNPNTKNHCGYTPLHMAAQFKNEHIIKLLINIYGADIKMRDFAGRKPLFYLELKKSKISNEIESIEEEGELNENGHEQSFAHAISAGNGADASSSLNKNLTSLRNRITHQSMLVRNTLRKSKAFQRRKSIKK